MSSIVSYAQNFEDILLMRVFNDISNGFYVDVGANDPVVDSVTKLFYDNGWTGINIEPLHSHFKSLTQARKRDINVNCAVSDENNTLDIWECEIRGWATLDRSVAESHELNGHVGEWYQTESRLLKDLLEELMPAEDQPIHFLKIDVEGFEKKVIQGNDWGKYRPWVVIVESVKPNSRVENYSEWEFILLNNNYQYVYSDGLNRYYLAIEMQRLRNHFDYPPNVFDDFITFSEFITSEKNIELNYELETTKQEIEKARQEIKMVSGKLEETQKLYEDTLKKLHLAQGEIESIINSKSWMLTTPFRKVVDLFKR